MRTFIGLLMASMVALPAAAADAPPLPTTTIFSQYVVKTGGPASGPASFKAKPGRGARLGKGDCCAKVNNQCVTICNKAYCSGVGDCITNPN